MSGFDWVARRFLFPLLLVAFIVAAYLTFDGDSTVEVTLDTPASSFYTSSSPTELSVGVVCQSLAELDTTQQSRGFVRVGLFGNAWPARVTEILSDSGGINFVRANGTPHSYRKYDGYRMQVVRLVHDDEETLAVFRSIEKY